MFATAESPQLGPGPRPAVLPLKELNRQLNEALARCGLPEVVHEPIRAVVLLWHDHLDASHRISQDLPGPDGSYLHGIMHRREPDYGNAKYWFQRVGRHVCFPELAKRAAALLEAKAQTKLSRDLIVDGAWAPFAFVDACEQALQRSESDPEAQLLRQLQSVVLELLLEHFCQSKD